MHSNLVKVLHLILHVLKYQKYKVNCTHIYMNADNVCYKMTAEHFLKITGTSVCFCFFPSTDCQ